MDIDHGHHQCRNFLIGAHQEEQNKTWQKIYDRQLIHKLESCTPTALHLSIHRQSVTHFLAESDALTTDNNIVPQTFCLLYDFSLIASSQKEYAYSGQFY